MKKLLSLLVLTSALLISSGTYAQKKAESPRKDASGKVNGKAVSINYGSPSVKGRKIWGELVPYNKVWRTGANEATVVTFGSDVTIGGQKLAAGKYAFFAIPSENEWTLIFNKKHDQWGAYDYSEKQDALRVKVKPVKSAFTEALAYEVTSAGFSLRWENIEVPVKVN